MSEVQCTIPCDYCKERPAFWFGGTSVAVCSKPECRKKNQDNYEEYCRRCDEEYEDTSL